MTREQVSEGTSHSSRASLPEEVKEILRQGQVEVDSAKEWLKSLTPLCPGDGEPGKFVGFEGAFSRGYAIYRCPRGHEFHRDAKAPLRR